MIVVRPQLGQTGIKRVDSFLATPIGKVITAGAIGVAAAKAYPEKTVGPFVFAAFLALATGLVPDIKTGG